MDTLPVELCEKIFELACSSSDGGSTARALSRVSRSVLDISKPFLYYSLVVRGSKQTVALEKRLVKLPQRLRRIRAMFLADDQNPRSNAYSTRRTASAAHLLCLAAPTVETLAVVTAPWESGHIFRYLCSLDLPMLRDLAMMGPYLSLSEHPDYGDPVPPTVPWPRAPNLERLHLAEGGLSGLFDPDVGLAASCPRLTQLRVSHIEESAFSEELHEAASGRSSQTTEQTQTPKPQTQIPSSLRRVILHPAPWPRGEYYRNGRDPHWHDTMPRVVTLLKEVAGSNQGGPCKYTLLPKENIVSRAKMLNEWMASVEGDQNHWT